MTTSKGPQARVTGAAQVGASRAGGYAQVRVQPILGWLLVLLGLLQAGTAAARPDSTATLAGSPLGSSAGDKSSTAFLTMFAVGNGTASPWDSQH